MLLLNLYSNLKSTRYLPLSLELLCYIETQRKVGGHEDDQNSGVLIHCIST